MLKKLLLIFTAVFIGLMLNSGPALAVGNATLNCSLRADNGINITTQSGTPTSFTNLVCGQTKTGAYVQARDPSGPICVYSTAGTLFRCASKNHWVFLPYGSNIIKTQPLGT